jgi:hypothetical protein
MRANIIFFATIGFLIEGLCAALAGPDEQFIDPDETQFTFSTQNNPSGQFCDLIMSAVKVPDVVTHNAVAWRKADGGVVFAFETQYLKSSIKHGIPSVPVAQRIESISITSDRFKSDTNMDRLVSDKVLYVIRKASASLFVETMSRGYYYLKIKLADGRVYSYLIRDGSNLSESADGWLKCIVRISS